MRSASNNSLARRLIHLLILRPLVKLIFGVNFIGREHTENLDQFIIISNHNSHLDIFLLFSLLRWDQLNTTHAVAEKTYFSRSKIVFRLVNYLFCPIWITRGKPELEEDPFADLKAVIERGHNLVIFPEGTRGRPGELQRFKSGIGRLMVQYPQLPIVPVFLSGPEKVLPKSSSLPLPFCNLVIIGPPQLCHGQHREITRQLQETILTLSNSEPARRHKRRIRNLSQPKSIAFIGVDGSGKSTISRIAAARLSLKQRVCLISDRLEFFQNGESLMIQPLVTEKIREAIGSYAKKVKSLKLYKIPKLTELLLRNNLQYQVKRWYSPDLIVMDGSPLLNMAAWANLYRDHKLNEETLTKAMRILSGQGRMFTRNDPIFKQLLELQLLQRIGQSRIASPDAVIFIDVSPAVANERILCRGEQRQVHETEEKLSRLREGYLKVCEVIHDALNVPVRIVDGHGSLDEVAEESLEYLQKWLLNGEITIG